MTSIDEENNDSDSKYDEIYESAEDEDKLQKQPQKTAAGLMRDAHGEIIREKGLSFLVALLDFLKGLIGSGFLALPWAFCRVGPWSGLILLFFIAFLNYYSMSLLVQCAQYHYVRLNIPYLSCGNVARETCKVSFRWVQGHGRLAKNIVNMVTLLHQFGVCSLYYKFIAFNLKEIIGHMFEDLHSGPWSDLWPWFLLTFLPMVVLNSILSLYVLSILCIIGDVLTLSSLAVILYTLVEESHFRRDDYELGFTFKDLPSAAGSIILACFTQAMVLPLENKIKKPERMLRCFGVLSWGIFLSTPIYACVESAEASNFNYVGQIGSLLVHFRLLSSRNVRHHQSDVASNRPMDVKVVSFMQILLQDVLSSPDGSHMFFGCILCAEHEPCWAFNWRYYRHTPRLCVPRHDRPVHFRSTPSQTKSLSRGLSSMRINEYSGTGRGDVSVKGRYY
uniref:Amino acid transporter transmembrane domain-containing protein n=1 Tax=Globodera rostochiensis TaxID=31243 RepID=A0A914H3H0_GLORO